MARFDTMLMAQHADPRVRNRLVLSTMGALALTAFGLAGSWTIDRLGIARVDAPQIDAAVLFDFAPIPPPPSVAPPPRPASVEAGAVVEPDTPRMDRDDPTDVDVELDPVAVPDANVGKRTVPGVPGGDGDASSTASRCLVPPCVGTSTIGDPIGRPPLPPVRPPKTEPDRVMAGIAAVKAQAIYAPDPDTNKLARTKAGTFDRRAGRSTVEFCVDTRGRVSTARTTKKFGDAEVDRICRETVLGWRFRPFTVDGAARKTCSSVTFDLHFE